MAKKIYDIKPPKTAERAKKSGNSPAGGAKEIKEFLDGPEKRPIKKPVASRRKKEIKNPWKRVLIGAGVVLILIAVYLFFKLPKANITIWPKTDVLIFNQTITADKTTDIIDMQNNVIPAQYLQEEKEGSEDFPATGSASDDGKATGAIKIYNKYDALTSITLKSGTHFLSDSKKYFVTLKKVIVPAAKKQGGKIVPGSIEVMVEAQESGPSYNIKPAKFSVPKLVGTAYYYSIYAESVEPMSGGKIGKIKKVTDDDIQSAKDALAQKLLSDAKNALKGNLSSDYILAEGAISGETESSSSSVKPGTVADNFTEKAKVVARVLVFKKSDLDKFAKEYILSKMPDKKTMLDQSFTVNYKVDTADIRGGKIVLNLDFSSKIYQSIDKISLVSQFKGLSASQIDNAISSSFGENVSKAQVKLWPFWVTKAPKTPKFININLKFE